MFSDDENLSDIEIDRPRKNFNDYTLVFHNFGDEGMAVEREPVNYDRKTGIYSSGNLRFRQGKHGMLYCCVFVV